MKYVDDLSMAQAIEMKECLVPNPNPTHPLTYHDRTGHILPSATYTLQDDLNNLAKYTKNHDMVINTDKCKVMMFNTARKYDGMPQLTLPGMGTKNIQVEESVKLLGVKIRSDLKWHENTAFICKRGYERLWLLRRLKGLGASVSELVDVYDKQVRPLLELAVPVWQPALTKAEAIQIERVQKVACHIILGDKYETYDNALNIIGHDSLNTRRVQLCMKFAKKALKNPNYSNWFCPSKAKQSKTRSIKMKIENKFKPVLTRTERYENSPLPYLTKLLNQP